jgi:hypothetical protein
MANLTIVPEDPRADGVTAGRDLGATKLRAEISRILALPFAKETLGAMDQSALHGYVMMRLETPPDTVRFPELGELYPDRLDALRGLAEGAGVPLAEAATYDYLKFRVNCDFWWRSLQVERGPGHCSGILLVGPDGVLGAHSIETLPTVAKPAGHVTPQPPNPPSPLTLMPMQQHKMTVKRPRTGYIASWGVTNEVGVGCVCGTSNSTWLDDPIEDVWPLQEVPLLRFARTAAHLGELYQRYTLHNWGRGSMIFGDSSGDAVVIEKSFRRVGLRPLNGASALWCTEGHFEEAGMQLFQRQKRLAYLARAGKHLGAEDMQYATDSAVRFTWLGHLCHQPWGLGLDHMRRMLTDHAPFPRGICRHAGPDTASYDTTVTQLSHLVDLTHNRGYYRQWDPWQRFCCEVPETSVQFPPRPR